jgi:RHS repeat-associated protein
MEFKFNSEPMNDGHYFHYSCGALMADYHKRICMMKYNYLTLPKSVQFRKGDRIEYVYDAAGVKRQTTHKVANRDMNYSYWSMNEPAASDFIAGMTVTTDYIGNKVYVNSQLKYVLTGEGYIEKTTGSNTYNAYYYLNDRLGNHRVVMDAAGATVQENNFYPSGASLAERRTDQGVQPYKFGGKELDRTNGLDFYDFEARAYDPVLMRFTRVDPLAVKYPWISPFAYCNNNPVNVIDPFGMDTVWVHSDGTPIARIKAGGDEVMVVNDPLPEVEITPTAPKKTAEKEQAGAGVVVATPAMGELVGSATLRVAGGLLSLLLLTGDTDSHQRANVQQSQQATTVAASPNPNDNKEYKKKKEKINNKNKDDIPDWVQREGYRPYKGENGKTFAKRVLDQKYGNSNYNKGATSEYSQLQKWVDTHFE